MKQLSPPTRGSRRSIRRAARRAASYLLAAVACTQLIRAAVGDPAPGLPDLALRAPVAACVKASAAADAALAPPSEGPPPPANTALSLAEAPGSLPESPAVPAPSESSGAAPASGGRAPAPALVPPAVPEKPGPPDERPIDPPPYRLTGTMATGDSFLALISGELGANVVGPGDHVGGWVVAQVLPDRVVLTLGGEICELTWGEGKES